jgi:hypothetical protein
VGKSTLVKILSGDVDWVLDPLGIYRVSIEPEVRQLQGREDVSIVALPGQDSVHLRSWPQALSELGAGKYRGVILVNANGYHTLKELSFTHHPLSTTHHNKTAFMRECLKTRKDTELSIAQELSNSIKATSGKVWLLSVITKQDLWIDDTRDVQDHYERGAYSACVDNITLSKGQQLFRHLFIYCSLSISNFGTAEEPKLAKNTAGYDQMDQTRSILNLIKVINDLKNWEELA